MSTVTSLTHGEQLISNICRSFACLPVGLMHRCHPQVDFDDASGPASLASSTPLIAFSLSASACSVPCRSPYPWSDSRLPSPAGSVASVHPPFRSTPRGGPTSHGA